MPPLSVTRLVTATELLTETQSQWLLSPTGDVADWHYYCSGLVQDWQNHNQTPRINVSMSGMEQEDVVFHAKHNNEQNFSHSIQNFLCGLLIRKYLIGKNLFVRAAIILLTRNISYFGKSALYFT